VNPHGTPCNSPANAPHLKWLVNLCELADKLAEYGRIPAQGRDMFIPTPRGSKTVGRFGLINNPRAIYELCVGVNPHGTPCNSPANAPHLKWDVNLCELADELAEYGRIHPYAARLESCGEFDLAPLTHADTHHHEPDATDYIQYIPRFFDNLFHHESHAHNNSPAKQGKYPYFFSPILLHTLSNIEQLIPMCRMSHSDRIYRSAASQEW
jgi:hypothetical protein